jgi:hypothetical protein
LTRTALQEGSQKFPHPLITADHGTGRKGKPPRQQELRCANRNTANQATLGENDHPQDDLGLARMDVLNRETTLHRIMTVEIPKTDCPQIATLALAVSYLTARIR